MNLNPYKIKWALYIDQNNVMDIEKSIFAANQESLQKKLSGKKGRFFIITDKQYGLTQNRWSHNEQLKPNTNLSVHFVVKRKNGLQTMIPMTKKQFENPVIS
ncbi:MAG: hypothetical protein GW817_12010 [Flavobacteriales bacterium]|nr:hypothetical protein [Flavobacteriales bacterium]NCT13839.1 hypothetical protein [Flavobacteriales bacterium]